jgi:hypothetical protein
MSGWSSILYFPTFQSHVWATLSHAQLGSATLARSLFVTQGNFNIVDFRLKLLVYKFEGMLELALKALRLRYTMSRGSG